MGTGKHYFVEKRDDGRFAVQAKNAKRASALVSTQKEAEKLVNRFNSNDHADVERVRNTSGGRRDKWRSER